MGTGTADILPECVIRKILCYLSYGEATRMRILSKTWLQAWLTLPNLAFGVSSGESLTIVDKVTKRYRDGNIPIDRFELHNFTEPDGLFPLIDKWLGIALQNGVKDLVYRDVRYSSSYPFPIFIFLAAESLRELVLTGCDLMHISLSTSRLVNCHSLRKLSLSCVHLDENMLQTLLISCPLIDTLIIEHCIGLNKIELRNLQKITSLTINIHRRVKIQAPTLEHLSYSSYSLEELDIVEYHNLKSLEISCMQISKGFLEHLISKPHFLESLKLVKITSGSFDICRSQSLRVLKIQNCEIIGTIDAPNLLLFEYKGRRVIPQLKFARESSQLKHSQIILDSLYNLDAAWFCKLRKFLSHSTSWSQVTLYFLKCSEINMKYLQLHHRIATPQVDILDLKQEEVLLVSCELPIVTRPQSSVPELYCFSLAYALNILFNVASFLGTFVLGFNFPQIKEENIGEECRNSIERKWQLYHKKIEQKTY
ncbi:putative F-box/LRR-repeat protein At3g18150 [Lycium barbarum]|uniref:putative F-box/LRR-repeat protein At3g18150 n=1 Tax=Lycium barbarum TaxID=112863 RepID=UPI00293E3649|nr:putative F-box/LRR-repeat protein At3g18150 [Lycium barbarum]